MIYSYQSLYHHEVDKLDKITKSLLVSIGNLKQVFSFLSFSSDKVHWLLLDLLAEFHFIFLFDFLQITLFINVILHFADDVGHFSCNDGFILIWSCFSNWFLLKVEICFLPGSILRNSAWNGFVLLKVKQRAIDFHNILWKGWFGEECIWDKFFSGFKELSVSNVLFPDTEDFSQCIRLEEADVRYDVKQGRLMHPIWKADNFSWSAVFFTLRLKLFFHLFRKYLDNTMCRDGIIFIEDHFFLIFIGGDNFQVVRPEFVGVDFLNTIDKLDGRGVTIFGKKWDCCFSCFYGLKNVAYRFIYKKCILNFILVLFCLLLVQTLGDCCVIGRIWPVTLLLIVIFVVFIIAFFVFLLITTNFWNGHGFIDGGF